MLTSQARGHMEDVGVTETLLEMYYFPAIRDLIASIFGVRVLRLLKPSRRREGWVGFDQGWVRTDLTTDDLYTELSDALQNSALSVPRLYFGFFLQFKIVEIMRRISKYTPPNIFADYYRSELDLTRSSESGAIQHHLLVHLASMANTAVAYACPMFFDIDAIYDQPDLETLRCVPVSISTPVFNEYERHFIAIQTPRSSRGYWCSETVRTEHVSFTQWIRREGVAGPAPMDGKHLISLIESAAEAARERTPWPREYATRGPATVLPQSFTIIEMAKTSLPKGKEAKITEPTAPPDAAGHSAR